MSDVKASTTLYMSKSIIDAAKREGINMSAIAAQAIAAAIDGVPFKDEELYLDNLIARKAKLEEKLRIIDGQSNYLRTTLTEINDKITMQQDLIKEIYESKKIAAMVKEINKLIVIYEFNVEICKKECSGFLDLLSKIRPEFNEEWLVQQIQRVRDM